MILLVKGLKPEKKLKDNQTIIVKNTKSPISSIEKNNKSQFLHTAPINMPLPDFKLKKRFIFFFLQKRLITEFRHF